VELQDVSSALMRSQQQDAWVESPEAPQIAEVRDGKKMQQRRVSAGFWQLPTLNQAPTSSVELNKPDSQKSLTSWILKNKKTTP